MTKRTTIKEIKECLKNKDERITELEEDVRIFWNRINLFWDIIWILIASIIWIFSILLVMKITSIEYIPRIKILSEWNDGFILSCVIIVCISTFAQLGFWLYFFRERFKERKNS